MYRYSSKQSTYLVVASLFMSLLARPATGQQPVEFDATFLRGASSRGLDVTRFANRNPIPAGEYESDLYVNNEWKGKTHLQFRELTSGGASVLCMNDTVLRILDLDASRLSSGKTMKRNDKADIQCLAAADAVPQADFIYRLDDFRLDVNIPQAYLKQRPRGYINPDIWQTGVPTAYLNYDYNFYQTTTTGRNKTNNTQFLNLNGGVNVANWHYRHQGSFNWTNTTTHHNDGRRSPRYHAYTNYLQRDIPLLKSQIMAGDFTTNNALFDAMSIRGVQLFSDDRMLPDSLQGFAPAVRGIAHSNALVTIRQNANIIHETTVPPGPFEINDLHSSSYGGDLHVTVSEANGSATTFTVPFNTLSQLLRPGRLRYQIAAGRLRFGQTTLKNRVLQTSLQYGMNNWLTVNAGFTGSERFRAILAGGAFNTPLGAFGLDAISSRTIPVYGKPQSGLTWRVSYSNYFASTKSNIALTATRYPSKGYDSILNIPLHDNENRLTPRFWSAQDRQKHQLQLTLNQPFSDNWGSAYLTAQANDYWNRSGRNTTVQAGYSNSYKTISYTLSFSRSREYYTGKSSNNVFLSFSIPIGKTGAHSLTAQAGTRNNNGAYASSMLAGSFGHNKAYLYTLATSHDPGGNSGSVSGSYRSSYGVFGTSASISSGYRQLGMSASGAAIVHPKGISFSEQVGNPFAIISAPGAAGATVASGSNAQLDADGLAIVSYLNPYQINTISIDPQGAATNVEFDATSYQVIPRANSAVLVELKTKTGAGVLFQITLPDGSFPPLGTDVLDEEGNSLGFVAQQGYVFVRGPKPAGSLQLRWGATASARCKAPYKLQPAVLSDKQSANQFVKVEVQCQ